LKWILSIGRTHNACHLSFQNDYSLNFQFITYLWLRFEKTSFVKWKLSIFSHSSQTWFKICGMTCEINIKIFVKVFNHFNCFCNILHSFYTITNIILYKYIPIHHDIHRKNIYYFIIIFLGLFSIIICNLNIVKLLNVNMV